MTRRIAALSALVLAIGCKDKAPNDSPAPKADSALPGTEGMDLAPSAMPTKAPVAAGYPNHVFAYTAARGLTLDGKVILAPPSAPAQGFDLKDKRNGQGDLFVVPLQDAVAKTKGDTALVAFEASTPYRIVAEVVFTIGQGGAATLEFLVRTPAGERRTFGMPLPKTALPCGETLEEMQRELAARGDAARLATLLVRTPAGERRTFGMPLPKTALPCGETLEEMQRELAALQVALGDAATPPTMAMVPLASRTPICIALDVASDGLGVRSRRDRLDASCSDLAKDAGLAVATLPAESGKLPLGAASICANTIKKRFPQAVASRVTVRASGETPWRDVVAVIDTFGPPGGFGDPILAAPK